MTLADHLEDFARVHGLEAPDTAKLRVAEARFDALLESAINSTRGSGAPNKSPEKSA